MEKHKVDFKSLDKSKKEKKSILENNSIVLKENEQKNARS